MIKLLCKQSFYEHRCRGGGPHPVIVAPSCPSCCSAILDVDRPSTSRPVIVVFHVVIIRCPSTTIVGTCLRRFSADSPEQHRRGEEDSIHPPSSYFLLIVVFIAVKEIIIINTLSPSHSTAHCPAITLTTAIAIVAVSPRPLQHPVPPHGILPAVG
jgi:hypothetical protein